MRNNTKNRRRKFTEQLLYVDTITGILNIAPGQTIIDAGCGTGYMAKEFSRLMNNKGKVYALDYDKTSIEVLKEEIKNTNICPIQANITEQTPIEASSVDLIYLSAVFHIFANNSDQLQGFQKEIIRLLKPNAKLAIVEIQKSDTPFGPPPNMRFSPNEVIQKISLLPVSLEKAGDYFYIQIFKKCYYAE